ncbi:hypothetical protein JWJ88_19580 [Paracoccus methylovorus]|uniref:Uncharacterized protein n=1 Tax=Paracoccus methylovorus TaxID=2812658 RepID=A0ABX7JNQ9_9RHOB|nr:hypothetical protein [Paracoccus methylovorus]QRZ15136.1 hypothetical protein JWJ88_19580 [Paracoccus methylovorus]
MVLAAGPAFAQPTEGVIVRCGASTGHAYFSKDETMNPGGSKWEEDGMRNGKIVLVKLGDEWDIQFDDSIGAYGYRSDGAQVSPIMSAGNLLTVGAFHENYVVIYNFDLANHEVAWSSNKVGTLVQKVAVYRADCGPTQN